jgi:hypothetical protein
VPSIKKPVEPKLDSKLGSLLPKMDSIPYTASFNLAVMEPDDPLQNSNMEIANMLNIDINSKPDSKAKPMKKLGE